MPFRILSGCLLSVVLLSGCGKNSPPEPQADHNPAGEVPAFDASNHDEALKPYLTRVKKHLPASSYVSNALLPDPKNPDPPPPFTTREKLRVGMPWILNDEGAPWYIAIDEGYFEQVGLEVELVAGGPGKDHLVTLVGGVVDTTAANDSNKIPKLIASRTGADVVMVGTILKENPTIMLGLDRSIPRNQKSSRAITPRDLAGATVGIQVNSEFVTDSLRRRYHLTEDKMKVIRAGDSPQSLISGRVDYMAAWIVNQPRLLEEQGYMNWTFLKLPKYLWSEYSDTLIVTRKTFEERPDVIRRYLWALHKATRFLLDNEEQAADITLRYATQSSLPRHQILRRFELQRDYILAKGRENILRVDPEIMDIAAANQLENGLIELPE